MTTHKGAGFGLLLEFAQVLALAIAAYALACVVMAASK